MFRGFKIIYEVTFFLTAKIDECDALDSFEPFEIIDGDFIGFFEALVWNGDFEEFIRDSTFSEGVNTLDTYDFEAEYGLIGFLFGDYICDDEN